MTIQEYNFSRPDYTAEETEECLREIVKDRYDNVKASQIFEAIAVARYAHNGQVRCNDALFIVHPMRVALMLVKFDRSTMSKILIAALLHDTLEKTGLTEPEIKQKFGEYVAKLVKSVTCQYETKGLEDKMLAKRQNWQEVMSGSHEARAIKTFENLDNMICWKAIPEGSSCQKKIPRWLIEAREMSLPLAHATNREAYTLTYQEYEYYVKQGFANQPITI